MATLKNPEIDLTPQQIDNILEQIVALQAHIDQASAAKRDLIKTLDCAVVDSVREGSIIIRGESTSAKLTRRVNVSYPKPRGEQSILEVLCEEAPETMLPMVRVEFKESGKKVEKFISQYPDLSEEDDPTTLQGDELIAYRLLCGRKESQGTPSLSDIIIEREVGDPIKI